MENLLQSLKSSLSGARSLVVLAVGSPLRGDDAAGLLTGQELAAVLKDSPAAMPVEVLLGETAPENMTGQIKRLAPSHLLIIDAADMGAAPGHCRLIGLDEPLANTSMSTHALPLTVLVNYIRNFLPDCQVAILGIQPAGREFNAPATPAVVQATKEVASLIAAAVRG